MKRTTAFAVIALIMLQTVVIAGAQTEQRPPPWRPRFNETSPDTLREFERRIETYVIGKIVISSLNFILYGYIAYFYTKLYRENNSRFSLVLTGLSAVLLVYSLSSNPLTLLVLRGSDPLWMNAFNFIPDLLATVVAFMMIYLTKT